MQKKYILTLSCPDKVGIVFAVSTFLATHGGNILESQQYGDPTTAIFFMRVFFTAGKKSPTYSDFKKKFKSIAEKFKMQWEISLFDKPAKVLIMVSNFGHCLNALLNKTQMGTLNIEIPAIVSNHKELEKMAKWYNTPFHFLPINEQNKQTQEKKVLDLIKKYKIDLVVLARYMQILSPGFVKKMYGRVINIHHSFLPSFKGARPYTQAYNKGVKLIGASAHYVAEDLDEGPIIEQVVLRVNHTHLAHDLVLAGQDIEITALIKAVNWHIQKRIFLNGNKTVVFK